MAQAGIARSLETCAMGRKIKMDNPDAWAKKVIGPFRCNVADDLLPPDADAFDKAIAGVVAGEAVERLVGVWSYAREMCDSPIEVAMLGQLVASALGTFRGVTIYRGANCVKTHIGHGQRGAIIISPQADVCGSKADFLVTSPAGTRVAVECDGHDYHERNKEQASRDRSLDRERTLAGYRVMRFTGSEIWKNPWACAASVIEPLWDDEFQAMRGESDG